MPCTACPNVFTILPCEIKNRNKSEINEMIREFYDTDLVKNVLKKLSIYCPCKNCLINSVCTSSSNCKEFEDIVNECKKEVIENAL